MWFISPFDKNTSIISNDIPSYSTSFDIKNMEATSLIFLALYVFTASKGLP